MREMSVGSAGPYLFDKFGPPFAYSLYSLELASPGPQPGFRLASRSRAPARPLVSGLSQSSLGIGPTHVYPLLNTHYTPCTPILRSLLIVLLELAN